MNFENKKIQGIKIYQEDHNPHVPAATKLHRS